MSDVFLVLCDSDDLCSALFSVCDVLPLVLKSSEVQIEPSNAKHKV